MHGLTLVKGLAELNKDDHLVSVYSRKLEYFEYVFVHDLVVVSTAMEFGVGLKHIKGVLSSWDLEWEIME